MNDNKTSKSLGFWRHFEEYAIKTNLDTSNTYATNTRQRCDEPEQRDTSISAGTLTMTKTIEEPDQDTCNNQSCAIPSHVSYVTKTHTFTREEPEQESGNKHYCAIPMNISCQIKTITEQREEPEQDESSHKYAAIPLNARV